MKIVSNRNKMKYLKEIESGGVFYYEGMFYMKICGVDGRINAVNVETGVVYIFSEELKIEIIDCELVIK